jgi:nucleotide-binding universal stress UspA family protein
MLLHVSAEAEDPAGGAAAYALAMAKALGAHLTTMAFELDVVSPTRMYESPLLLEGRTAVDRHNRLALDKAEALRAAAAELGIEADVRAERSYAHGVADVVAHRAHLVDWVVAASGAEGVLSDRAVAEYLIFHSARPVIIVPTTWTPPWSARRILVGWDYSRSAARALSDAMPLLRTADDVRLLAFGDDKAFDTSIDGNTVVTALARRGVAARFEQADRGALGIGAALAAQAADADLLVMGAFGHSRLRDFVLGGATKHMMKDPALPILMSH